MSGQSTSSPVCKQCGQPFQRRRPNQQYCSARCKWTWTNQNRVLKPNVFFTCKVCGNAVERYIEPCKQDGSQGSTLEYCSRKCKGRALSGENHPMWKGGRCVVNGYVWVYQPDHPHAKSQGYVLEHRLVMEKAIGRYLDPAEVVHHKNDDTQDNRLENLQLYASNAEHKRDDIVFRERDAQGRLIAKET